MKGFAVLNLHESLVHIAYSPSVFLRPKFFRQLEKQFCVQFCSQDFDLPGTFRICEEITSQLFARLNAEVLKNMTGEFLTASNKRTK